MVDSKRPAVGSTVPDAETRQLAEAIGQVHGLHVYAESIVATGEAQYFLSGTSDASHLAVISADSGLLDQFEGSAAPATFRGRPGTVKIGPRSGVNAAALRTAFPS